jgi:hypothetical protein
MTIGLFWSFLVVFDFSLYAALYFPAIILGLVGPLLAGDSSAEFAQDNIICEPFILYFLIFGSSTDIYNFSWALAEPSTIVLE